VKKQHHKNNVHNGKCKKAYYIRARGKHVKTEPKKEEWEGSNRNGALDFCIWARIGILKFYKFVKILKF
jgi:hypothetical protein